MSKIKEKINNIKSKKAQEAILASTPEMYQKLGLKKEIEEWEDGIRTDGRPGTYEWWYFDTHFEDGTTLVIGAHTKNNMNTAIGRYEPYMTFELTAPDGTVTHDRVEVTDKEFSASKETCDVKIGSCTVKGNLTNYVVHFKSEKIEAELTLDRNLPSWRPETGYFVFGDKQEYYFAWLPSVPNGVAKAKVTIDGKTTTYEGSGYHDHNWGNANMPSVMHDWYWGRAKVGEYSLISVYITAAEKYGYAKFPVFMLVTPEGKVLDRAAECLKFEVEGERIDKNSGKPYDDRITYIYDDKETVTSYRISYFTENIILSRPLISQVPAKMKPLLKLSGFDGAYMRFTGKIELEKREGDKLVEEVKDEALWEIMYFGKNIPNVNLVK